MSVSWGKENIWEKFIVIKLSSIERNDWNGYKVDLKMHKNKITSKLMG